MTIDLQWVRHEIENDTTLDFYLLFGLWLK